MLSWNHNFPNFFIFFAQSLEKWQKFHYTSAWNQEKMKLCQSLSQLLVTQRYKSSKNILYGTTEWSLMYQLPPQLAQAFILPPQHTACFPFQSSRNSVHIYVSSTNYAIISDTQIIFGLVWQRPEGAEQGGRSRKCRVPPSPHHSEFMFLCFSIEYVYILGNGTSKSILMSKSCAEKRSSVLVPPLGTSFFFSGSFSCSTFGVTVIAASMASLVLLSSSYSYNTRNSLSRRTLYHTA